jgi:hypothetical protein
MKLNRFVVGRIFATAVVSAALLACEASIPPPNTQWAIAQADVGRAQAAGAPNIPDAKLHLQLAQEDLATSRSLFDRDNQRASTLIALARVEAQLALSLAKETSAAADARLAEEALAKAEGK